MLQTIRSDDSFNGVFDYELGKLQTFYACCNSSGVHQIYVLWFLWFVLFFCFFCFVVINGLKPLAREKVHQRHKYNIKTQRKTKKKESSLRLENTSSTENDEPCVYKVHSVVNSMIVFCCCPNYWVKFIVFCVHYHFVASFNFFWNNAISSVQSS